MLGRCMADQAADMEFEYVLQYVGLVLMQHLQQSAQLADFRFQLLDREQHGILLFNISGASGPQQAATAAPPGPRAISITERKTGDAAVACSPLLAHLR